MPTVKRKEVEELFDEFNEHVDKWKDELVGVNDAIDNFLSFDDYKGKAAEGAKNYFSEAHKNVLGYMQELLEQTKTTSDNLIELFSEDVDTSQNAIIHSDYSDSFNVELKDTVKKLSEHNETINQSIDSVEDIADVSQNSFNSVETGKNEVANLIDKMNENLANYEANALTNAEVLTDSIGSIEGVLSDLGSIQEKGIDKFNEKDFESHPFLSFLLETKKALSDTKQGSTFLTRANIIMYLFNLIKSGAVYIGEGGQLFFTGSGESVEELLKGKSILQIKEMMKQGGGDYSLLKRKDLVNLLLGKGEIAEKITVGGKNLKFLKILGPVITVIDGINYFGKNKKEVKAQGISGDNQNVIAGVDTGMDFGVTMGGIASGIKAGSILGTEMGALAGPEGSGIGLVVGSIIGGIAGLFLGDSVANSTINSPWYKKAKKWINKKLDDLTPNVPDKNNSPAKNLWDGIIGLFS